MFSWRKAPTETASEERRRKLAGLRSEHDTALEAFGSFKDYITDTGSWHNAHTCVHADHRIGMLCLARGIECDKARIEIAAGMAVREADQAGRDDDIVDEFRNDLLASSSDYSSMQALQVDDIMKEIYYRPPRNPKTAAQNVLQKRGPQHNAADDGGSLISDDEYCTADTVDRPVLYTEGVDDSRQGTAGARNARNPHHTGSDSQHFDMTSPATSHPIGVRYKGPTKRYPPVYVDGETAKSSFFNRDTVLSLAAASAISLGTLVYIRPELPSEAMKTLAHGARYALSSLGSALDKVRGWGGETNSNGIASAILGTAVANSIS